MVLCRMKHYLNVYQQYYFNNNFILIRFGNYFIQNRARELATGYPNYGDPITNIIVTKFTKQNDITKLIKMCQCNKTANNS